MKLKNILASILLILTLFNILPFSCSAADVNPQQQVIVEANDKKVHRTKVKKKKVSIKKLLNKLEAENKISSSECQTLNGCIEQHNDNLKSSLIKKVLISDIVIHAAIAIYINFIDESSNPDKKVTIFASLLGIGLVCGWVKSILVESTMQKI